MDFRLLGPLEVVDDEGAIVQLGGRRPRAVLAMLLLHPNEVVSTDRLIDAVWGERPPPTAHSALQVHVHALRKSLGADRIVTRAPGYLVRVEPGDLDVERFEALVGSGSFREAEALWRGPALADVAYEPFAQAEAARLEERRLSAIEARIESDLDAGRHREVVAELDSLVAAHPEREALQARRMVALYRSGRQTEALEAYRAAREALDEVGLEPTPELRALERRILEHDTTLAARASEQAATPVPELIGRDLELAALTALLREPGTRLLTLTGPGGTGKTTLARATAAMFGGAPFVDLAPIGDPTLVMSGIATALGIDEVPDEPIAETIASQLKESERRLVVVDNLEHLPESYPGIAELIEAAPNLQILATSRSPLRISAEREYRVQPLDTPPLGETDTDAIASTAAVRLYLERAGRLVHDVSLTTETVDAAGRIARALDGLPLAIELAAARVRVFGVQGTAQRIGEALSILTRSGPDLHERQRSLRATIEWSVRLLEPSTVRVLQALAAFPGGARLDALEAVAGVDDVALALDELLDTGLAMSELEAGGEPRFSMLETIRAYALDELTDEDEHAFHVRQLGWAIGVAHGDEPRYWLRGTPWLDRVEPELPNIRAALDFARDEHDLVSEVLLATSMRHYWRVRGHLAEGRSRLEELLARSDELDLRLSARLLQETALMRNVAGEYEGARQLWLAALAAYGTLGDESEIARMNVELGACAIASGDPETAIRYCRAAAESPGVDEFVRLIALGNLAECYELTGELDLAHSTALEVLAAQRANGDRDGVAYMSFALASISLARGNLAECREHVMECMAVAEEVGFPELVGYALGVAAAMALALEAVDASALLIGASLECLERLGVTPQHQEAARSEGVLDALRLRDSDAEIVVARGRAMPLSEAIELAGRLAPA